ncbi:MAG: hypothetical protein H6700_04335 [Myxococcales bacterium]|nr:hypothetical protein [Myxococcales bacterium]
MSAMFRAARPAVLAAFAAGVVSLAGCGDDVCTRVCPSPQVCVIDAGEQLCLEPNCGSEVCTSSEECVDGTCRPSSSSCASCSSSQHCVSGVCVDAYTASNACDPLRQCRLGCGVGAACLAACEDDAPAACTSCLTSLDSCQRTSDCVDSGPYTGCCETQFCACYPSAPGCGTTAACVECQEDCGSDASCFSRCRSTALACNLCLEPFDTCAAASGAAQCVDELCSCLDSDLEADCR